MQSNVKGLTPPPKKKDARADSQIRKLPERHTHSTFLYGFRLFKKQCRAKHQCDGNYLAFIHGIPTKFAHESGFICDGIDKNGNACEAQDPQNSAEGCALCFKCKYCLCHDCVDEVTVPIKMYT